MAWWSGRRAVGAVAALLLVLGLGWAAIVVAVAVQASRQQAAQAEAIAVLGAAQYNGRPSPVFRARLDHAAALYLRGVAPVVLVTGGVGRGDTLSETAVGESYLLTSGLPGSAVIPLPASTSTYDALQGVAAWFRGRQDRRVVFVSDGFHMLRIRIIAPRLGLVPFTSPAPGSPIHANPQRNLSYMLAEGVKVPVAWLLHR